MTKVYKFSISTRYVGSTVTEDFEFDDDVEESEVQATWEEWVWNNIDGGFTEVVE